MKKFRNKTCTSKKLHITLCFLMGVLTLSPLQLISNEISSGNMQVQNNSKPVTINAKNRSLDNILSQIKQQTSYAFGYQSGDGVNRNELFSLSVTKVPLEVALRKLFEGSKYTFIIKNKMIIISARTKSNSTGTKTNQKFTITGKVIDENKNTIIVGASVIIEGTNVGTSTDSRGNFTLSSNIDNPILTVSSIGYKTKNVTWNPKSQKMTIQLSEDVTKIDDVQIIAYGERNKRDVVSSISSVKASDIKDRPAANVMNLLQGRVAGLEITNQSGAPGGSGQVIAIRGYTALKNNSGSQVGHDGSPLYVVDGVIINSDVSQSTGISPLAELDPNVIESIEVLKDAASAALYGSRAGNGVILITTKKGKKGDAQFTASASYSVSHLPVSYVQTGGNMERWFTNQSMKNYRVGGYDRTNGVINNLRYPKSYQENYNNGKGFGKYDAWWNNGLGTDLATVQDSLNPFYNNSTNWFKKAFRPANVFNANVGAQGGTERVQYMTSLGYYDETGIMQGSDFQRVNMVNNMIAAPIKRLTVETNISLSYSSRNSGGSKYNTKIDGMTLDPLASSSLLAADGVVEDKFVKNINSVVAKQDNYNVRAMMRLRYEIIKGLTFSTMGAVELSQANTNIFTPSEMDRRYHENKSYGKIDRTINVNNDNILTYKRSIDNAHNIELMGGMTLTKRQFHQITGQAIGGASDKVYYVDQLWPSLIDRGNGNYESLKQYSSNFTESSMVSYMGRIAYNYNHKYLIEATMRRDGSSKFGENCKYANFPSVAVGWNVKEEQFMKQFSWLDLAKFRASWGRSGQMLPEDYLAHGILTKALGWNGQQGLRPSGIINKDLTWEKSDQYNIGFDVSVLNYRANIKLDYYQKYTSALLYLVPLHGAFYYATTQYQNAMEVSNEGIELEVDFDIFRNTPVKWRTRFNIARNWNRFEKSYGGTDINSLVIGRPLYQINAYEDNGYWDYDSEVPKYYDMIGLYGPLKGSFTEAYTAGTRKIVDQNGDGTIDIDDAIYCGSTLPKAYGGWTNDVSWKNFTVNVHFSYSIGRKVIAAYNYGSLGRSSMRSGPIFTDLTKKTFWEKPGDNSSLPMISPYSSLNSYTQNYKSAVENVSFIRLQQLSIAYNIPKHYMRKIGFSGGRVFITGENLFILSNYTNYDPETSDISNGRDEGNTYPLSRKWVFGASINF